MSLQQISSGDRFVFFIVVKVQLKESKKCMLKKNIYYYNETEKKIHLFNGFEFDTQKNNDNIWCAFWAVPAIQVNAFAENVLCFTSVSVRLRQWMKMIVFQCIFLQGE